ncbi:MAG: hypothetical protein ACTSRG_25545 [Candidatus Helarchaeota archaeon]
MLTITNRKKQAVKILFFFIPIAALAFHDSKYFILMLGLNAFIIWSIWLAQSMKNIAQSEKTTDWSVISNNVRILYYFLFIGFFIAILNNDFSDFKLSGLTPIESIINFSLFILTLILFLKIIIQYRFDFKFQDDLLFILLLTVFFQFGCYLLSKSRFSSLVPGFLTSVSGTPTDFFLRGHGYRFWGLLGDWELIVDYNMAIIGFSLILTVKKIKIKLSIAAIFTAIISALLSGTRSFLIVLAIFMFIVVILNILKKVKMKKVIKIVLISFFLILVGYKIINKYVPLYTITKRIERTILLYNRGDIQGATNRKILEQIPFILENVPFLGFGSIRIFALKNENIISHSLYFNIYTLYGILGLISILYLFIFSLYKLTIIWRKSKNEIIMREASIYIALLVSLAINQVKISCIRNISPILIYATIFIYVYFLNIRFKLSENE